MTKEQIQTEALNRAVNGISLANYPAIFEGFTARGIPECEIKPRENVFTFHAWKKLGRRVKKGEHGVRVCTWIEGSREVENKETGEIETRVSKRPWTSVVFHVTQTTE